MRALILCLAAGLLIAGCASYETQIIDAPGRVETITVGQFITRDPVDNELIGFYLRKELSKRGFVVSDDSPYVISGVIDVETEGRIVLCKNSKEKVTWFYTASTSGICTTRKCFSKELAKHISIKLRE